LVNKQGKMPQSKFDNAKKSGFSAIYRQTRPKFIEIAIACAYSIVGGLRRRVFV